MVTYLFAVFGNLLLDALLPLQLFGGGDAGAQRGRLLVVVLRVVVAVLVQQHVLALREAELHHVALQQLHIATSLNLLVVHESTVRGF